MIVDYNTRKLEWQEANKDCTYDKMLLRYVQGCLTTNEFHAWLDTQIEKTWE